MKRYSVVIVEDHLLLSQAIAGIVNSFENFHTVYLCRNGKELIEKFAGPGSIPDIVLMDINMPVMNGVETTVWIKENHPAVQVLALSVEEDEDTILQMLRAGASGYLLKDVEKSTLEKALEEVMDVGFYHSRNVTALLLDSLQGNRSRSRPFLKENEIEFMKLVCTELTYKEIADKMCLSPKTIDGYRDDLFDKLQVKNRIGLAVYAIKNKIYIP